MLLEADLCAILYLANNVFFDSADSKLWFDHTLTTTSTVCPPSASWSHVPIGRRALAAAVALVKVVHGRRLIGSQQIRYLSVTS